MSRVPLREVLVGLATFLVVGGVLMQVVVAQRFATAWPVGDVVTTARGTASVLFDPATLTSRTDVPLTRRRSVVRTVSAVPGADAYVVSTSTTDDGRVVVRQRWAAVQSTVTGAAIDSSANAERSATFVPSGDVVEGQRALRDVRGVVTRFPRGTEARSYTRFDPETRRSGTASFVRRARLAGSDVLVFRQVMEPLPDQTAEVPGGRVTSDTTVWVRPEIGAVVKTSTHVVETAEVYGASVTTLDARFVDDAASVRSASAAVDRVVARDRLRGTILPAVAIGLGAVSALALVIVGWFGRAHRRRRR